MRALVFSVVAASILLISCLKKEDFSYIPMIKYEQMSISDSSIILKITFTDGDGDIGLKEDEEGPFAPCSEYHYNLFVDPQVKTKGEFVDWYTFDYDSKCYKKPAPDTGYFPDTVGYYFRTAYLVPEGKDKNLEGEIYINLNDALITFRNDTVRFNIKLLDRAHNQSNVVESEVVVL